MLSRYIAPGFPRRHSTPSMGERGRLSLLLRHIGSVRPQHELLNLPGSRLRQLVDERPPARGLEVSQPVPRERDQLFLGHLLAVAQEEERGGRFTPPRRGSPAPDQR